MIGPTQHSHIVCKFGGSSLDSKEKVLNCIQIINEKEFSQNSQEKVGIVVVSALRGVTPLLNEIYQKALEDDYFDKTENVIKDISARYLNLAFELELSEHQKEKIKCRLSILTNLAKGLYLLKEPSLATLDRLLSQGESLSAELFAQALEKSREGLETDQDSGAHKLKKIKRIPAQKLIATDDCFGEAHWNESRTQELVKANCTPFLDTHIVVTEGFIGEAIDQKKTTTLGLGGSDYSAAILAHAINAKKLEIWTDVFNVCTADPKKVPQARAIYELTYGEAQELGFLGGKVLHPLTLVPAMKKHIPVYVGHSQNQQVQGTWIREKTLELPRYRAISTMSNQVIMTLSKMKKSETWGHLLKIFAILNEHQISIHHITTSEIATSLTFSNPEKLTDEVLGKLNSYAQVEVERDFYLISIIGNNFTREKGVTDDIFHHLKDYALRMISLGPASHSLSFMVAEADAKKIIETLHQKLFEFPDQILLNRPEDTSSSFRDQIH